MDPFDAYFDRLLDMARADSRAPLSLRVPFVDIDFVSSREDFADAEVAFVERPGPATLGFRCVYLPAGEAPAGDGLPEVVSPGRLTTELEARGRFAWFDTEHRSWTIYDPEQRLAVRTFADARPLPPWEHAFPMRLYVHWALGLAGARLIHAGTLGLDGDGVLIAGNGGAGKSGTVLAGLVNGLSSAGDDYVVIDTDNLAAHALLRLVKQDVAGIARCGLTGRADFGPVNWQGKYEFDFETLGIGRRAERLDLRAILLPQRTGGARSSLRPAPAHAAMMALAPSNLHQLPGAWKQGLVATATLARRLPAFHLDLGTDPVEIADTIRTFLSEKRWRD